MSVLRALLALSGALTAWLLLGEDPSPGRLEIAQAGLALGVAGWFGRDAG